MHARSGARPRRVRIGTFLAALALVAAGCGGDDSSAGDDGDTAPATPTAATTGAATTTDADPSPTTAAAGEPTSGGSATVLLMNEIAGLDPISSPAGAGSDGQRMFALYGGLVTFQAETNSVEPLLAESFTPNDDFTGWTLTLRDGIVFSDGTPYDAAAVQANWERAQDPANLSPAMGYALTIASMTVVSDLELEVELVGPNAHFPNSVSLSAMNYIASPQAIASGHDLTSDPVGAGPFLLERWTRDDSMALVRNPDYVDAPRPYLDELTFRIVTDEQQRLDTYLTGDADAIYTSTPSTVARAEAESSTASFVGVTVGSGQTYLFNTAQPPFDDVRVRRAFVLGVDRDALVAAVFGEGAVAATNFSRSDSPWFTELGALPDYDPVEAQRLIDEVSGELGHDLEITIQSFQQPIDQERGEYIQAALSQFDHVTVDVEVLDSPTAIGRVFQGDFQVTSWGAPFLDPEPGLYREVRSGMTNTNNSRYANAEVDRALDEARSITDLDQRAELYGTVFAALARDLPYLPYLETTNGYVVDEALGGLAVYEDGILRSDLLWSRG